ncbi:TNF receptor-associated factor family protein DDB_G0272098-like [Argonauta hians]
MSRYDVEKFHPPPDPELICCICQCVLDNAKESPCRHVFCKVCIEHWLEEHNSCPTCRTWLNKHDLQNVLPLVQNMINKLAMYCDFRNNGCDETIILELYDAHIEKCDFKLLQCPYPGCNSSILHKDLSKHMNEVCTFRQVTCNKGCYLKIPINEIPSHDCLNSLKLKSEKQQKLIEEYLKKIKEFISLNYTLKKKVENLLRNFDDSGPHPADALPHLFTSSYEEEEVNSPISVLRRTADNSVSKLLVMCNYLEVYTDAIDQITDEINLLRDVTTTGPVTSSAPPATSSASIATAVSAVGNATETIPNSEDSPAHSQQNVNDPPNEADFLSNSRNELSQLSQSSETYMSNNNPDPTEHSDQPINSDSHSYVESALSSPTHSYFSYVSGSVLTSPEHNTGNDRELEDSYVVNSEEEEEGEETNFPADYTYNSDESFEYYVGDEEEINSDVSRASECSYVEASTHLGSYSNDAVSQPENFFDPEYWIDTYYPQSSERGNDDASPENEGEADNVSVSATDGDSYTHPLEEHYLSSSYLSSPSITSAQCSPLISSSPHHESDSDMYVYFSDYSDDENNHHVELLSDNEDMLSAPMESQCDNPRTEDSQTLSDNEDERDNEADNDDDRNSLVYQLTEPDNQNCVREENEQSPSHPSDRHTFNQLDDSSSFRVSASNNTNLDINEVSITHVYSADNKLLTHNERSMNRVSSQVSLYQQRHHYFEVNPEPLNVPSQHHVLHLVQSNKDSTRVTSGNADSTRQITPGVSIKIEPSLDFIRVSSSDSGNLHKSVVTARTMCVPLQEVNTCSSDDVKVISESFVPVDTVPATHPSSQNSVRHSQRRKRQNSVSSSNSLPSKVRRVRDSLSQSYYSQSPIRNRVGQNMSNQQLNRQPFPSRQRALHSSASTASSTNLSIPANPTVMSSCRLSSCTLHPTSRGGVTCNSSTNKTKCNTKIAAAFERQMPAQSNAQMNQREERSLTNMNSVTTCAMTFSLETPDLSHSNRSELIIEQSDSDNASYEPSESCSDSDIPESDSSYEVLIPKTISQLLDEYNSEETDDSWSVGMD